MTLADISPFLRVGGGVFCGVQAPSDCYNLGCCVAGLWPGGGGQGEGRHLSDGWGASPRGRALLPAHYPDWGSSQHDALPGGPNKHVLAAEYYCISLQTGIT